MFPPECILSLLLLTGYFIEKKLHFGVVWVVSAFLFMDHAQDSDKSSSPSLDCEVFLRVSSGVASAGSCLHVSDPRSPFSSLT